MKKDYDCVNNSINSYSLCSLGIEKDHYLKISYLEMKDDVEFQVFAEVSKFDKMEF